MTVYPFAVDDDSTIIRIDDNISEIGDQSINQAREAIFAIETELGIEPSGTLSSVADRLDIALNPNGTIKASALTSVGLVSLPIDDAQVGASAAIKETKLALDFSTGDLNTLILSNKALLDSLTAFANEIDSDLNTHIAGGTLLGSGSPARHVASHIDINATPSDARDPLYTWSGLLDKDGTPRTATQVTQALDQINTSLTSHENATDNAHVATAIDLDVSNFEEVPQTVDTLQKFVDYVDDFDVAQLGEHRAVQHDNAVPKIARAQSLVLPDGYRENVIPPTPVQTYLVRAPNTMPVDDFSIGDDIVKFVPADNSDFSFDEVFGKVRVGDEIRINYANGLEAKFYIDSIRFIPGTEWIVRLNGVNLADSDGYAVARIDRAQFDVNTAGVLAVAAANATPLGSFDTILSSVVVGHPKGAVAIGIGFDPGQFNATHYNLHLELYPTGNPTDRVISMPAIDVTGDTGLTPGSYTLESIVHTTNLKLREIGFNFRMIAFAHEGEFGIMMADPINNASFGIVKGVNSAGTLIVGSFSNNVIGEAAGDTFDALGFGSTRADVAGVNFASSSSFVDADAAQINTKVIPPLRRRHYIVNGRLRDDFADTWMANEAGYWDGYISARTPVGLFTIETTYTVFLDLEAAELKPGKTILVQPSVDFSDPTYFDVDYGRFIIKEVNFIPACPGDPPRTLITVINGLHASSTGFAFSSSPNLGVRLYFGEDSVGFNNEHIRSQTPTTQDYRRHHEIFVTEEGKTFSHERARMPVQAQVGFLLNSNPWHVEEVSPKLRGFRDSATTFTKFVRFYILSYDTDTGEFDGYIGKRVPSTNNITQVGPITRGRKNITTRFYDETNIDYIDLTFVEEAPTLVSETLILTDGISGGGGTPRYVDIEIFNGLRTHDELFLLATCEVNWDPQSSEAIVQRVTDRREFGSVAEDDFTTSAINFINAGDRLLHENGVLRGLEFESITAGDPQEVNFKGGVALVNGVKAFVNNQSVTIPEISENTAGLPDFIEWAVCVNEEGNLEPIIITPTKQQFFAIENTGGATYYVPSVTFTELVETRKDLTPIYTLVAEISSFTLTANDLVDVRRFINDSGRSRDLVVAADGYVGNFGSFLQLVNWVNKYEADSPIKVKVRGEFTLDTSLTLGLSQPVIFEGDGATIHVRANKGIILSDNITFKNITFNYNPDTTLLTFQTDDKVNSANGCLYSTGARTGVTIEDCVFNSSLNGQRPPFICFETDNAVVIDTIKVRRNEFSDSGTGVAEVQAAIAIVNLDDVVSALPAVLYDVKIEDNKCNQRQGIYIIQDALDQVSFIASVDGPGTRVYDTSISGNNCGAIGFLVSATDTTAALPTGTDRTSGLSIRNNTCHLIGNMANYTFATAAVPGTLFLFGTSIAAGLSAGSVDIHHNHCSAIGVVSTDHDISADTFARIAIESNKITATDPAILNNWRATYFGTTDQLFGILASSNADDGGELIIANNIITSGLVDSTVRRFTTGINSDVACNITGNIVRGLATSGSGIIALAATSGFRQYLISKNQIFREGRDISRYIGLEGSSARGGGLVVDNWLDEFTLDGSDDEVISGTGTSPGSAYAEGFIVERNKNQTGTKEFSWCESGAFLINDSGSAIHFGPKNVAGTLYVTGDSAGLSADSTNELTFINDSTENSLNVFSWQIPVNTLLPIGVQIIDFTATATLTGTDPDTVSRMDLHIQRGNGYGVGVLEDETATTGAGVSVTIGGGDHIVSLSSIGGFPNNVYSTGVTTHNRLLVEVTVQIHHSAANTVFFRVRDIILTYRW